MDPRRTPSPTPHLRVLLVDDDPLLLRALARQLRRLRADVVPARSVREALALLRTSDLPPHLIVTELELPDAPGEELLRAVRADRALAAIPVVAMSARPAERRFDRVLEKPFALWELRAALRLARAAGGDDRAAACERLLPPIDVRPGPARPVPRAALARMVRAVLEQARAA